MPVTTELVLARHGEAACNVVGLVGGPRTCTGLTDRGREQVARLATRLTGEPAFDALYTSPRQRTQDTAAALAHALNLTIRTDDELRGLDHGAADGCDWTSIKTRFGGRPQRYPHQPIAEDAEAWNTYLDRTSRVLASLIHRHEGQRILIAAHGETIEASFAFLLGLPRSEAEQPGVVTSHASLTRWQQHRNRFGHTVWMLAAHNDIQHLAATAAETATG
ncbi:histidine phosphatase family protein [Saccharopolyspora elongata]|uniref:Histidine phosphatase family protein n=1 Tax=Saccharopolyspora elongata TaxID=2530387 RepID=A0A4R4YAZ5_9PSEU|nr:histidine phosphatase family protein [Saccharopolyspora elongata]TDD40292.1 histidine phosphatase family protein [Saccharopolyspora elongata]